MGKQPIVNNTEKIILEGWGYSGDLSKAWELQGRIAREIKELVEMNKQVALDCLETAKGMTIERKGYCMGRISHR